MLNVASFLGFTDLIDVSNRSSIRDLIPASKKRCGIYLLVFDDGTYYIGQSTDVVKRFSQHWKNHKNIVGLGFQPVTKANLNDTERSLIYQAQGRNVPLTNRVHASAILGSTDLDALFTVEEQHAWLRDSSRIGDTEFRITDERLRRQYHANFERYKSLPLYETLITGLAHYLRYCVPAHRITERSYWALSCLPSTNGGNRFNCLSINQMEVFVMLKDNSDPNNTWGFLNVAKNFFYFNYSEEEFYAKFPNVELKEAHYDAGASDQMSIWWNDVEDLAKLLDDGVVRRSIKLFNLRLMRAGSTTFHRYHCLDLVDALLEKIDKDFPV